MAPIEVYRVELDDDGSPAEGRQYYRLPPPDTPYILRFTVVNGALASNKGVLWLNYPEDGQPFKRSRFHSVPLTGIEPGCDVNISRSGAFEYFMEHSPEEDADSGKVVWKRSAKGYFVVDPQLRRKKNGVLEKTSLPLEGLVIESVVPKWLGKLSQWKPHLETIANTNYDMIHFVPLQQRGASNSPYSIFEQLRFDPGLFEEEDQGKSIEEQRAIVKNMLDTIENEYGILSLTDIVWNHTAHNTTWLWDHPEAGYNLHNSPHLIPAFELDNALIRFSAKIADPSSVLTPDIKTEADLKAIMKELRATVFADIKLWEFYVINVNEAVDDFEKALKAKTVAYDKALFDHAKLNSISFKDQAKALADKGLLNADSFGPRFYKKLKVEVSLAFIAALLNEDLADIQADRLESVLTAYRDIVNEVNLVFYKNYDKDVETIVSNIESRVRYIRLDEHGPRMGPISESNPLVEVYFTKLPKNERTAKHPEGSLAVANNGWIWNADPLQDFASKDSHAYLRREVIIWGDCVKLRYGKGPDDVPWLWQHMKEYTIQSAKLFHGFRIDNCHSTPLHLAQYLLDAAREVRPNLYVVAELFTGSEEMDITFVSRLGINSLIREAMQAWDPRELSRLVHRHGIKPVGAMDRSSLYESVPLLCKNGTTAPSRITPLLGSHPHALFMDCTHDNETPHQKRRAEDTLSNAALVCMTSCAIGSVKGYDEVYPALLNLVTEKRLYTTYKDPMSVGICKVKSILNKLHTQFALEGYEEAHVHHENEYILVHRQQPSTLKGYILIAHTSFYDNPHRGEISPIKLRGTSAKPVFSFGLKVHARKLERNDKYLTGLPSELVELADPTITLKSDAQGPYAEVIIPDEFPGGSVILLETIIQEKVPRDIDEVVRTIPESVFQNLDWIDLNVVLYRCDGEERDTTPGNGAYNIPHYGSLVYCGLQGWVSVLKPIIEMNDLGHPLCSNLRDGHWALDYISDRIERHLKLFPKLAPLHQWYQDRMTAIKLLPNYLTPRYFALVIMTAYDAARKHAFKLMDPLVQHGDEFTRSLALTAMQVYGYVDSTSLHPTEKGPCLAAGLPHFTYRHMRTWGRDVFISLRGILLVTGNYEAAKDHILAFASSLKHGTIPNLLDSLRRPRYNSRDSVWWFFQAVQDYTKMVPGGESILKESVLRRFPLDDTFVEADDPRAYSHSSTVAEVLQEIMTRHANGIHYREWNAGPNLDSQMSDRGFQVDVDLDLETGFVTGGSVYNCGTWMDKMGESAKAGSKGVPATPRDGADVEIIGLLKSSLRWLIELHAKGLYEWDGVELAEATFRDRPKRRAQKLTFKAWNDLIQKSFERCFYIPSDPTEDPQYEVFSELVNRRGIYKDTYGSVTPFADYQFRPNFPVAMVVAPELFDRDHAREALELTKDVLLGPLGMRTLDPLDWAYRPNYDNQNDSDDRMIAKGWNYHQGPEWLWCTGYFFRAYLQFQVLCDPTSYEQTVFELHRMMLPHKAQLETSPWAGLAELTNLNGAICHDACQSQAWSSSTLLDLLYDVEKMKQRVRKV